jgi:autotransporter translocation and assembly factor TamB
MKIPGILAVCLTLILVTPSFARAADITGKWKAEFESRIGFLKYTYDLKAEGGKLSGKATRELDGTKTEIELKEAKLTGEEVSFVEIVKREDQEIRIEYTGKVAGNEIKFTRKVGDFATTEMVAKREMPAASLAGRWQAEFDTQIGKQKYLFTLAEEGGKVTGKANAEIGEGKFETKLSEGKLQGDQVSFVELLDFQGNALRITYTGKLAGDELKLKRQVGDVATEDLVAKRMK